jgi:valyl-tRNA synthetase
MIMLGLYVTDKVPFKHVYLHGMVLDEKGQKMSKSKGNVINPIEEVARYGSDALRLGIIASRSPGQNQAFSINRVIAGRNFANKLWNVARFIEGKLGDNYKPVFPAPQTLADHWVIRELLAASNTIARQLEEYRFAEASETVYHTVWDVVADWYIEASKGHGSPGLLAWVLDTCLKLTHSFAPFVTETIWQSMSWHDDLLMTSGWPEEIPFDDIAAQEFERLQSLISELRLVTSELPGNGHYNLLFEDDALVKENTPLIKQLTRVENIYETDQPHGLKLANSGRQAWLDISEETLLEHQTNLETRLAATHGDIQALEGRLHNDGYIEKAPASLVEESRKQLQEKQALVERLQHELEVITLR